MNTVKLVNTLEKRKVPVEDLQIGMYVSELDIPWLESPFLLQGFVINTQKQLNKIRQVCRFVYIEEERGKPYIYRIPSAPSKPLWRKMFDQLAHTKKSKRERSSLAAATEISLHHPISPKWLNDRHPPQKTVSFGEEFANAEILHKEADNFIRGAIADISNGKTIDAKLAKEVVEECVNSILRIPDTFMLLTQLKNRDQYTAQHSLNVSIYAVAFGRYLNLSYSQLTELGLSGMMHDMGKLKVPKEILHKPGKLEPDEMQLMRRHTTWGRQILMSGMGMPKSVIDVAHSHHERCDGAGYPRGLTETQISPLARIIAIADTYDAVTSNRFHQEGYSHLEALKIMIDESSGHLDPHLVVRFIECLGIYPPGCLVLLDSGEIGVVTEINPQQKLRPKIILLLDENKQIREETPLDLATCGFNPQGAAYTIRSVVKPETYNIDINQYRQKGIFMM